MPSSRQRLDRKARAARRNAARAAENVAALAATAAEELAAKVDALRADAADQRELAGALIAPAFRDERRAYLREARRIEALIKEAGERDAALRRQRDELANGEVSERQRAIYLLRPHRDPPPDAEVVSLQTRAEAQRQLATKLDAKADAPGKGQFRARQERKRYRDEARRLDREAAEARERQLTLHRQAMDARETLAQAKARGVELEEVATETPHWLRDEHGAIVRDDRGLPALSVEKATTRRQKHGLDWLLTKARITSDQWRVGKEAERVWLDAAQAAQPNRGATLLGGHYVAGATTPGVADWRIDAMRAGKQMEAAVLSLLGGLDGEAVLRTCKAVCFEGQTIQRLTSDRYEQGQHEERLKLGLALIGYWMRCGSPKIAA